MIHCKWLFLCKFTLQRKCKYMKSDLIHISSNWFQHICIESFCHFLCFFFFLLVFFNLVFANLVNICNHLLNIMCENEIWRNFFKIWFKDVCVFFLFIFFFFCSLLMTIMLVFSVGRAWVSDNNCSSNS